MSSSSSFLIVNTDLDATLLDHDTYSWQPATEALQILKSRNIPLILNSSKTLAEMTALAEELEISHPLVCENGSLIAVPKAGGFSKEEILPHVVSVVDADEFWICHLGSSRDSVLEQIANLRIENPNFTFQGYADWTTEQVAEHTGLPLDKAALSHQRNGTEPIHWHGSDEAFTLFQEELSQKGLKCVSGGRFIHLSGQSDKANGLRVVNSLYQQKVPEQQVKTIALGDSPNDLGMLNAAQIAVVIPNKVRLEPTAPRVIHAEQHGPEGWNTVMLDVLR